MNSPSRALVGYHQFALAPVVNAVPDPARPFDLLQVTDDGRGLMVATGITDGPVWLSVGRPDPAGPRPGVSWDATDEAAMSITSDLIYIAPTTEDSGVEQPVFSPTKPGPHRVTVFAWGINNAPDQFLSPTADPVEEYVVWIRPQHQ